MDPKKIKTIVEASLMAAGRPLSIDELQAVFGTFSLPERQQIRDAIKALQEDYEARAMEIKEVASGFRVQVRTRHTEYISRLWDERPPRYSRALMETLALIAYRQPITRGEIEEVRGVSVSTNIVRTLLERNWVRVVGHRDVPGRPAMFGTTREFLDYFGLKKLDELPSLRDLQDIEDLSVQLQLPTGDDNPEGGEDRVEDITEDSAEPSAEKPAEDSAEIPADDSATESANEDRQPDAPRMHLVRNEDDGGETASEADSDSTAQSEVISHS